MRIPPIKIDSYAVRRCVLAFGTGLLFSVLLTGYVILPRLHFESAWVFVPLLGGVLLFWPCYKLIPLLAKVSGSGTTKRWRKLSWLVSAAGALLLLLMLPLPGPYTLHRLEIRSTGERNPESKGAEVWVQGLRLGSGGKHLQRQGWQIPASWKMEGHTYHVSGPSSEPAVWVGRAAEVTLLLTRHEWSGHVAIRWGGNTRDIDLYSPSPAILELPIQFAPPLPPLLLWWAAHWAFLSILLALGLGLLGGYQSKSVTPGPIPFGWGFGSVSLGGILYLLALFPGVMTSDSTDQWNQMETGIINDTHPAFHTLTNWLLTRLWHSPAAVGLAQILVFSLLITLFVRELGRMGARRWSQVLVLALASLWPLVGVYLVTLWKDIPFSLGVLGLSYCLLKAIRTRGAWLRTRIGFTAWILASLAVLLYRHNGPLLLLATHVVLVCVRGFPRRRLAISLVVMIVAFVSIKGPIYHLLHIAPVGVKFKLQNQIHQVSAMVSAGASLRPEERDLLASIQPLDAWTDKYTCYSVNSVFYSPEFNQAEFEKRASAFIHLYLRLATEMPGALFDRQLCISSLVWRITPAPGGYLSTWSLGIDRNDLGLRQRSLLPFVKRSLETFDHWSKHSPLVAWLWRPAAYLWVALAAIFLAAFRRREPLIILLALPIVANSGILMLFTPSQSARYQFCVYLIALLTPALVSVSREQEVADQDADESEPATRFAGTEQIAV